MVKFVNIIFLCISLYGIASSATPLKNIDIDIDIEDKNKIREPRNALRAVSKYAAKLIANALTYTSVAIAVNKVQKEIDKHEEENAVRTPLKCDSNNVGCLNGICWTNCGPELQSSDYCFTTRGTLQENRIMNISNIDPKVHNEKTGVLFESSTNSSLFDFIPFAKCTNSLQCDKCFECANSCFSESYLKSLM